MGLGLLGARYFSREPFQEACLSGLAAPHQQALELEERAGFGGARLEVVTKDFVCRASQNAFGESEIRIASQVQPVERKLKELDGETSQSIVREMEQLEVAQPADLGWDRLDSIESQGENA
jgi:hypothetical protein